MALTSYLPRIVDVELTRRLRATGAVLIEGPRACGKTATARQMASSEVLLDVDTTARETIQVDPRLVLDGPTPRLIDEWQVEPVLWNHIRRAVDDRQRPGQFILTGSAVPADEITRHTGAGRIGRLRMRPMALVESGHATGDISLAAMFEGSAPRSGETTFPLRTLAERICVGGWPGLLELAPEDAAQSVRDYLGEVRRTDIRRVDGTARDPETVARVLRSLGRNVATEAAATTLAADIGSPGEQPHPGTVREYLVALERLMVVEDQPAWSPHLRSRSILRKSPKRHFVDPSLAAAAVGASPVSLLRDIPFLGALFESLVVRDLRILAQPLDGRVLHYRDNTGLEVDAVIALPDGRWGAVEVKLGRGRLPQAVEALTRFRERIDTRRSGEPAFLAVILPGGYGLRDRQGIDVVPLSALGP